MQRELLHPDIFCPWNTTTKRVARREGMKEKKIAIFFVRISIVLYICSV